MENYHMEKLYSPCWDNEVDEQYFEWLCELVDAPIDSHKGYWFLLRVLHTRSFIWLVPNDDNRVLDGLSLRQRFCDDYDIPDVHDLGDDPCSIFEMMVALAIRMDDAVAEPYEDGDHVNQMFFEMLSNLDLADYTDDYYRGLDDPEDLIAKQNFRRDMSFVNHKLNIFLRRQYKRNGKGGLFPLQNPKYDQRKVEIWYQMNEYIIENYMYEI